MSPGTSLCSHGESPAWSVCEGGAVQPQNPPLVSPWSAGAPVWGRAGSCPSQCSCPGERLFEPLFYAAEATEREILQMFFLLFSMLGSSFPPERAGDGALLRRQHQHLQESLLLALVPG